MGCPPAKALAIAIRTSSRKTGIFPCKKKDEQSMSKELPVAEQRTGSPAVCVARSLTGACSSLQLLP